MHKKIIGFVAMVIVLSLIVSVSVSAEDGVLYQTIFLDENGELTHSIYSLNEGVTYDVDVVDENGNVLYTLYYRFHYLNTPLTTESVFAIEFLNEDPEAYLTELDQHYDSVYPATKLSSKTRSYNCHSYAWHNQSTSNIYWINDPSPYYTDGSYYEVTSPQVGDIICYFYDNETTSTSDDENIHSGVVTEVLSGVSNGECGNSDLVTVTSKWGVYGLYSHNGYECPYTNYYPQEKEATYVKYYRAAHVHSYTHHYAQCTTTVHYAYCSCGDYVTEAHNMVVMDDDPTKIICTECNYIMEMMKSIP